MAFFKCKVMQAGKVFYRVEFASTPEHLSSKFQNSGMILISSKKIHSKTTPQAKNFTIPFLKNVKQLLENNFSILSAIQISESLFEESGGKLIVSEILSYLRSGSSLSQALAQLPALFDKMTIMTIEVAEQTAKLPKALDRIVKYLEEKDLIISKLRSATRYPLTLIALIFVVSLFWLFCVVPQFAEILEETNRELPFISRGILWLSRVLCRHWGLFFVGLGGVAFALYKNAARILKSLPFISRFQRKLKALDFSSAMHLMLSEQINLVDCLESIPGQQETIMKLKQGLPLSQSLNDDLFDSFEIGIISAAEQSGELASSFQMISQVLKSQVMEKLKSLTASLPIFAIGLVGGILAIIIYSLILPMYDFGALVS